MSASPCLDRTDFFHYVKYCHNCYFRYVKQMACRFSRTVSQIYYFKIIVFYLFIKPCRTTTFLSLVGSISRIPCFHVQSESWYMRKVLVAQKFPYTLSTLRFFKTCLFNYAGSLKFFIWIFFCNMSLQFLNVSTLRELIVL